MTHTTLRPRDRRLVFALIVGSTVTVGAGTDLMLPAVPSLPAALGGSQAEAQLVLAANVAGAALGLAGFGELGARVARHRLLCASLALFTLATLAAAAAPDLAALIGLRFVQGALGAAPVVFAPGLIRAIHDETQAVAAIGRLGSVESLTPALAPVAGVFLQRMGGWQASFLVIAAMSLVTTMLMLRLHRLLPRAALETAPRGGYARLLGDAVFLRYAVSQALSVGGLIVFVFGAPAVFSGPMRLGLSGFIMLQMCGVATFILCCSLAGPMAARFGTERMITLGTLMLAAAFLAILVYALAGGRALAAIVGCFLVANGGLGLRGPPGFNRAVVAAGGDDTRGAALVVLGILGSAGAGTALIAPFITLGLAPLAGAAAAVTAIGATSLLLPRRVL